MVNPLLDITGKKAIVTGGTRGLGHDMAEGLLESGCEVCIVGSSASVFRQLYLIEIADFSDPKIRTPHFRDVLISMVAPTQSACGFIFFPSENPEC